MSVTPSLVLAPQAIAAKRPPDATEAFALVRSFTVSSDTDRAAPPEDVAASSSPIDVAVRRFNVSIPRESLT
jgi:hypothetical protein